MGKEQHIPKGCYCYDQKGICPYWSKREDKPDQENGFCSYLNRGDWDVEVLSLLWDQVKECGINDEIDLEDYEIYPLNRKSDDAP